VHTTNFSVFRIEQRLTLLLSLVTEVGSGAGKILRGAGQGVGQVFGGGELLFEELWNTRGLTIVRI
jgi:hypothetical protein